MVCVTITTVIIGGCVWIDVAGVHLADGHLDPEHQRRQC